MLAKDPLLAVFDGNNLMIRAYFGNMQRNPDGTTTSLMTSDGRETGALYGVIKTFMSYVRQYKPSHVLWTFDHGRSAYRTAIRPEYKANRGPKEYDLSYQFGAFDEFLSLIDARHYREENVEADDLMACAAKWGTELPVMIVSVDHDIRQLASKGDKIVSVLKPAMGGRGGGEVLYTYDRVVEGYGLEPHRLPEKWALMGDGGDNIIGIKGIGPKKAMQILDNGNKRLHDVVFEHPKVIPFQRTVMENYHMINLTGDIALFNVTLEECTFDPNKVNENDLREFFKKWEFNSFLKELDEGKFWFASQYEAVI